MGAAGLSGGRVLTNPPKGDRSGGGAGLGLGGVKEKLCQKRVEEKSRRKESDRSATGFGKLPRRLFIAIKLHEKSVKCVEPPESRETKDEKQVKLNLLQLFGLCSAIKQTLSTMKTEYCLSSEPEQGVSNEPRIFGIFSAGVEKTSSPLLSTRLSPHQN